MKTLFLVIGVIIGASGGIVYFKFIAKQDCKPFVLAPREQAAALAPPSKEVPITTLDGYVRNYRTMYPNNSLSFNIEMSLIDELHKMTNCEGIRVYMGMRTPGDANSGTVVITGYGADRADLYIQRTEAFGIDEASPCPKDCPWGDPSKPFLGR